MSSWIWETAESQPKCIHCHRTSQPNRAKTTREDTQHLSPPEWSVDSVAHTQLSLFHLFPLYPLQCQKCQNIPSNAVEKACREGQGCTQKAQVGGSTADLAAQTTSRDERGSVIRAGFPSLPAKTPEAARKTLWWVGMGENQEASICEASWWCLLGLARSMFPATLNCLVQHSHEDSPPF